MFARVYTAPPQEVFFDMYENDASFDEAAKNLYNQELEQGYDTDLLDEFLEPGIEDFDETAVEKAIYQTAIAQEQGRNPVDITITPYGSGLLQDEYDEIINIYPGIGAGVEWRTMDDHDWRLSTLARRRQIVMKPARFCFTHLLRQMVVLVHVKAKVPGATIKAVPQRAQRVAIMATPGLGKF